MKQFICISILLLSAFTYGQTNYKITYLKSSNGKLVENQDAILVFSNEKESLITSEAIINQKSEFPFEQTLITNLNYLQVANLNKSNTIATKDSTSIAKQSFELQTETRKILGYNCKKAKIIINSNTIEVWYTNDLKVKGAPTVLGQNLGLVLEMNRNGNFIISATKVEKTKQFPVLKIDQSKTSDVLTYRDLLWKSRFTTIPIFKDEVINFSDASKSNDSIMRFANGTIILKKIKVPSIAKGSQVFIDVTEQSNGDAYDRTGSIFMIPMDKKLSFLDGLQNGVKSLPLYDNGN